MRILLDGMGGDHAPRETVKGAVQAAELIDDEIVIIGIDDETLKQFGPYHNWDRTIMASALEQITKDKEHLPSSYRPITKEVKTTIKRGSYTSQKFSGEWTLRQKNLVQERISKLLNAVIEATKTVNDTPTMEPNLATDKLLKYIFYGNE